MSKAGDKQLADARLDNLGSNDRGDGLVLGATAQALVDMAAFLITEAQQNLQKDGSNTTGDLESSMSVSNIAIDGTRVSVDVLILDRYKFINDGVKGVRGGVGKYQFRTPYPNKKMATALMKWAKKRGIRGQRAMKYAPVSSTERKDVKVGIKKSSPLAIGYAIATNIKKNGIKPTRFFTKAITATTKKFKDQITAGFKLDIIESLK